MKRSNFIKSTLLFLTCIALWSCSHADIIQESTDDLPPLQTDVKYNPEVQNIMFNNCITCHGGPSPSAGLDLTTYQNVRASAESSNMIQRMNDIANPMPPSGVLSAQIRQQMDKWVADGFPEN
ncbi:c-type cytochrome domain-containing protein [Aquimarina rhabdastrellae]